MDPHARPAFRPDHYEEPLAPWERELLGVNLRTVAVFTKGGDSHVFNHVDPATIRFDKRTEILSFDETSARTVRVPNVAYWTEQ